MTLSGEEVPHIPQSSSITEFSPSDCLVPYQEHTLRQSYRPAEMQSMYFSAPADRAIKFWILAATPHKAPTLRPPASHHENYPS